MELKWFLIEIQMSWKWCNIRLRITTEIRLEIHIEIHLASVPVLQRLLIRPVVRAAVHSLVGEVVPRTEAVVDCAFDTATDARKCREFDLAAQLSDLWIYGRTVGFQMSIQLKEILKCSTANQPRLRQELRGACGPLEGSFRRGASPLRPDP